MGSVGSMGKGSAPSLYSCLDDFFRTEQLEGVSCNSCSLRLGIDQLEKVQTQKAVSGSGSGSECEQDDGEEIVEAVLRELRELRVEGGSDCFLAEAESRRVSIISPLGQVDALPSTIADRLFRTAVQPRPSPVETAKRTAVSRLPSLLCMYLCRRVYDEGTGKMRKIDRHVAFPVELQMGDYRSSNPSSDRSSGGLGISIGGFPSFLSRLSEVRTARPDYLLRAVVCHQGNAESGMT
jgi:ubiquitin carboxyl-terminal hydrolase 1